MIEEQTLTTVAVALIPLLSGLLIAVKKWFNVSAKVKQLKKLVDSFDEALEDDKLTKEEFKKVFANYKKLVEL